MQLPAGARNAMTSLAVANRYLILASIFLLCILSPGCSSSKIVEKRLGEQTYRVPAGNLLNNSPISLAINNNLDPVESIHLIFTASETSNSVQGFQSEVRGAGSGFRDDLTAVISVPSDEVRQLISSGNLHEGLWHGTGDYGSARLGRRIQEERELGFRVYYNGIDSMWALVDRNPQLIPRSYSPPFNSVIARCRAIPRSEGHYSCRRTAYLDSLIIEYEVTSQNIRLYRDIDQFIVSKLRSWRS